VYGVELNGAVAQAAREQHQLEVFAGTLEEAGYPAKMFDVVTLWDVLEHLHDPAATLREIHRILKDDGILVVRVPNLASWNAHLFGRYWAGLDAPRHLYVFSPATLTRLQSQNGLKVFARSSAIAGYLVFVLSVQFWLNAHNVAPSVRQRLLGLLNHPVARLLSAPFFYLPARLGKGPLLVTTAAKEQLSSPHGV
jgi:SAM-dependent methyltransferase